MTWEIKTEFIGTETVDKEKPDGDMTELRKITATHVETGQTYQLKARMGTEEYKKAAWDNIFNQHAERTKVVSDSVADEGVAYLNAKETG